MSGSDPKPTQRPSSAPAKPPAPSTPVSTQGETRYENAKGCLLLLALALGSIAILAAGYYFFGEHR